MGTADRVRSVAEADLFGPDRCKDLGRHNLTMDSIHERSHGARFRAVVVLSKTTNRVVGVLPKDL